MLADTPSSTRLLSEFSGLVFGSAKPPQQKTPRRGGGALLGLLQGGEICISIYVDPWEVGEPGLCRVRRCGKQRGDISTRGSTKKSCRCSLVGFLLRILEQRTNVCAICV